VKITKEDKLSPKLFNDFSEQSDYQFWDNDNIDSFLKSELNSLWILWADKKPIGMVLWSNKIDQLELIYIFIKSSFRRSNHAQNIFHKSLLKVTERLTNNKSMPVFLEVRETNTKAIKLYQKLGFKKSRVRKSYYSDGSNAYEMLLQDKNN